MRVPQRLAYSHIPNMVFLMKTTLNIDATVMQRVREEAARRGTTISALVEAGLRRVLEPDVAATADPLPELPRWRGGEARVDVANRTELAAVLDEE